MVIYNFNNPGARSQLALSQLAQTNLATSRAEPITMMGIIAAEKIAANPTTE